MKKNGMYRANRKPRKALKTIKVSDAAEAFPRLLFSTFSGQSLSHPIWINRWASRSSSPFLSNKISLNIIHCRSDIRGLSLHGRTAKTIHSIFTFTDDIILEVGFLMILNLGHHRKILAVIFPEAVARWIPVNGVLVNSDTYQMRYETFQTMRSFWRLPITNRCRWHFHLHQ